jgi:hypothetical protein
MSGHVAFRRQPVPGEMAIRHSTMTLPAPIRGINENENWAYTKPGAALILDNWFPTQKGLKLRGGTERWLELPDPVEIVRSGFEYVSGATQRMFAATTTRLFDISFADSPVLVTGLGTQTNGCYSAAQLANTGGDWLLIVNDDGDYVRRYNGTAWAYLTTTTPTAWAVSTAYAVNARALDTADNTRWKCLVAHTSPGTGTFAAARTAAPTQWTREMASDNVSFITAPATAPALVQNGKGLTHIWKHANRLFFIQGSTMNAWCLPVNAVGGELVFIPLSGAMKRGGSLLFGASWSVDSGSGLDDKCIFVSDQGEVAIFSGTDPTSSTNWKQEGCYDVSRPLSKYGHQKLGGDILIATVDGIVPLTATMQKDLSALSLAAITYNIEPMWTREYSNKRTYPFVLTKWPEGNALIFSFPGTGGTTSGGSFTVEPKTVGVSNLHTGSWCRYTGWDAMCFVHLRGSLFFGTQDGKIMQAESTGRDDTHFDDVTQKYTGNRYVCTMLGGWEMFQAPPNQVTWMQARAAFFSSAREPFIPQLAATVDYEFKIPPPPDPGPDPGLLDVWDQGLWGPTPTSNPPNDADRDAYAQWDQPAAGVPAIKNTMWVSIGETGFSHAPIVQVSVEQQARPDVELISVSATFLRMAANV